jgi:outer membrane biosynthesis protein TonB
VASLRHSALLCVIALLLALNFIAGAQQPTASVASTESPQTSPSATAAPVAGGITEEELKQLLSGKALYLRGGYLDNALAFDEHGHLAGHSPQGSYTLSAVQIEKIRLTKHKVELQGIRYGLHFVGQLAYEDPATSVDRVRITPKKKVVRITIDREIVVKPKKKKDLLLGKGKGTKLQSDGQQHPNATAALAATTGAPAAETAELSPDEQVKASIAAAPEGERPADAKSVTATTSPAHATRVLKDALEQIFAPGLDDRMLAAMPDFWKLYYQAVAAKIDYRPSDPSILRQNTVDQKARLLSTFEPDSNEFAQANGVAGMALYHTVIGTDGKAGEIAVGRPIGFGLDENAVAAIRKANFQPAIKAGKPVPVLLDLVVQFRIFSNRTAAAGQIPPAEKPAEAQLPGPYSVQRAK